VALLAVVVVKTDPLTFLTTLRKTNLWLFGLALVVCAVSILVRSYKWQLLLRVQGGQVSLTRLQTLNYIGMFYSNFLPGGIGGDAYRIYKTMDSMSTKYHALSAVVMDRLTGLVIMAVMALLAGSVNLVFSASGQERAALYGVIGGSLLCCVVGYSIYVGFTKGNIARVLRGSRLIQEWTAPIVESLSLHARHRKTIHACLLLSTAYQVVLIVGMYVFGLAGGVSLNPLHLLVVIPAVTFLVMLPISVNGIGVQEGALFFYLQGVGVDPASTLVVSLLPRVQMIVFSLIGAVLLLYECMKPHEASDGFPSRRQVDELESR